MTCNSCGWDQDSRHRHPSDARWWPHPGKKTPAAPSIFFEDKRVFVRIFQYVTHYIKHKEDWKHLLYYVYISMYSIYFRGEHSYKRPRFERQSGIDLSCGKNSKTQQAQILPVPPWFGAKVEPVPARTIQFAADHNGITMVSQWYGSKLFKIGSPKYQRNENNNSNNNNNNSNSNSNKSNNNNNSNSNNSKGKSNNSNNNSNNNDNNNNDNNNNNNDDRKSKSKSNSSNTK